MTFLNFGSFGFNSFGLSRFGFNNFGFNGFGFNKNRPQITSNGGQDVAYLKVKENGRFVTDVQTYDKVSTESNGRLSYSISGEDSYLFEIDHRTGKLYFKDAPDFENPLDHGKDNVYKVKVKVIDGAGYTDTQVLKITVENVEEVPVGQIIRGDDSNNDLFGTAGNDFIFGEGGNDFADGVGGDDDLFGGAGDDVLHGGGGNDFLNGTDPINRGKGEVDNLNGNAGRDIFALGDAQGAYYLGDGFNDFAIINDFSTVEDTIVLSGSSDQYTVADGTEGNAFILNGGDAIAQLKGVSSAHIDLTQAQFQYV